MPVIAFEQVGKQYPWRGAGRRSLREELGALFRHSRTERPEGFWALRGVTFAVKPGEALGIIGPNGAGKTTILKLIANITAPTQGRIRVGGRVASLIELGAGFHPELTGRENVFLNGSILGLGRRDLRRRLDEIVAFAELQSFIDQPIKHYSSGMYVRLGFATAAHAGADILLLDEVLSVGDARFQQRSLRKMRDLRERGTTTLLVSHNLATIAQFCPMALWIQAGQVAAHGETHQVIDAYLNACRRLDLSEAPAPGAAGAGDLVRFDRTRLLNRGGEDTPSFRYGDTLRLQILYHCQERVPAPNVTLTVRGSEGQIFQASMLLDGAAPPWLEGSGVMECIFQQLPLIPGSYHVVGSVRGEDGISYLMHPQVIAVFLVEDDLTAYGWDARRATGFLAEAAPVVIPHEWRLSPHAGEKCS